MSYLMDTVTRNEDIQVIDAEGCWLHTPNGKYMDWFMDCGVTPLGYRPVSLLSKIADYCLPHIPNSASYELRETTAYVLCDRTGMDKAFFCNSGTEAVEAAIKIIRKWNYDNDTRRKVIYTVARGFHGRTLGSLAAGNSAPYHYEGFQPLPSGFLHFEDPSEIDPDNAAGILLEPIAGNNDVRERGANLDTIAHIAVDHDIPLAFDEIQSGAFRTGCFTASELYSIKPDIICLGKGIACGIPTGVTLVSGMLADTITPGTHYSTFGGSPLSMLGISTLFKEWDDKRLLVNVGLRSEEIKKALREQEGISEVRGRGMMLAIEFNKGHKASDYTEALFHNSMFVPTFRPNVMKFAPPLNLSEADCHDGLLKLGLAFAEAARRARC